MGNNFEILVYLYKFPKKTYFPEDTFPRKSHFAKFGKILQKAENDDDDEEKPLIELLRHRQKASPQKVNCWVLKFQHISSQMRGYSGVRLRLMDMIPKVRKMENAKVGNTGMIQAEGNRRLRSSRGRLKLES